MQEIWEDIKGYEGFYQVSNLGRVKSRERLKRHPRGNGYLPVHERILRQSKNTWGYSQVTLYKDGKPKTNLPVHRLVAQAFIPNPDCLPEVNHKDENKSNNAVSNLEWCTAKYNENYGTHTERCAAKRSKPVVQLSLAGTAIALYRSAREAGELTGCDYKHISDCCLGIRKTHGHYQWRFAESA